MIGWVLEHFHLHLVYFFHTWIIHWKVYSECPCAQLSARETLKNSACTFIELTCLVGEPRQYKELANCEVSCPLLRNYFAYNQHRTTYQFTFLPYNLCRCDMRQHCPVNEILSDSGSDFKVCLGSLKLRCHGLNPLVPTDLSNRVSELKFRQLQALSVIWRKTYHVPMRISSLK